MVATDEFVTLGEIRRAAASKVPTGAWNYLVGGADTESTLRNNRRALGRYVFRPRVLRDVSQIDTTTTFLGMPLAIPIMIAPMGSTDQVHPDGDLALARAAGRMGTIQWLTTVSVYTPEEVAAVATGPLVYQLYFRGDDAWGEALIRRVEAAGFKALALTVDVPAYGRRERDIEARYNRHAGPRRGVEVPAGYARQASLTWKDVEWLQRTTTLPLIIKGIGSAADARLAAEHGVPVVYISNHGGRQLDFAPASIDLVAEVVDAVAGRAEVVVDGGFTRGTDALKALALGARAVCIGKAAGWGLGAAGEEGVVRVLELLALELRIAMANTGVARLSEVSRDLVRRDCVAG